MKQTSSQPRLDGKIPGRIKYTFALGALGKDMIYGMIATFSMIYFTDIIKVNPVFIGVMFFVAKLWDAFNDLFMGMIVDNTRSRWGKFIPWLVIGTLVNSIVFVVLFTDFHLDGVGLCDELNIKYDGFIIQDKFSTSSGYKMMSEMISKGNLPTAIFAASDHIAIGAMRALQENGYKIPEDISVMGFDNTELSGYTNPPLTTVNAPVYAMGIYGIRFILNMMKSKSTDYFSPMRVYLPCPIKVRNSCAKPKSL